MSEYKMLPERIRNGIAFSKAPAANEPIIQKDGTYLSYPGFGTKKELLSKGFKKGDGYLALEQDVIFEKDTPIPLRDGTIIYADIYRPNTGDKVPVLLNSTPFSKSGELNHLEHMNRWADVKKEWISGYQSWEALDPFFWCNAGYALVTIDVRGAFMSEGRACYFGSQDAQDNYDVIEYLGNCSWSNGKVAMGGNSWLSITQWFTAALCPPHLAAIAPWEGHGNMYADEYVKGGIPNFGGARVVLTNSENGVEDLPAMMRKYPLMNEYWEDKCANFEKINIPAYVVASYTSAIHTHGTFEAYRRISSKEKWLRIHNTQEWQDFYNPENSTDLKRFFDHYLKNWDNGWETTPKIRMSVLDAGHEDTVGRIEQEFPLSREILTTYYLDASTGALVPEKPQETSSISYDANPEKKAKSPSVCGIKIPDNDKVDPDNPGIAQFKISFEEETEITGYMKVKLWMEADGHNDMDVYVRVSKQNAQGDTMYSYAYLIDYTGPLGMLRASLRETDPVKSTATEPYHPFRTIQYLEPKEIVPLEIGLWPTGLRFHPGEVLCLTVAGYDYLGGPGIGGTPIFFNRGQHIIYTGGEYDSHLIIPIIPAKNNREEKGL